MMGRPWTAIASNKEGIREMHVFEGGFDGGIAIKDFKERFPESRLEALIPGTHSYTLIQQDAVNSKGIPADKLFSGF
jgi:hypothetical protein